MQWKFPAILELLFGFRIMCFLVPCRDIHTPPKKNSQSILINPILVPPVTPFLGEPVQQLPAELSPSGLEFPLQQQCLPAPLFVLLSPLLIQVLCIHSGLHSQSRKIHEVFIDVFFFFFIICFLVSLHQFGQLDKKAPIVSVLSESKLESEISKILVFKRETWVLKEILERWWPDKALFIYASSSKLPTSAQW